jgi:hypothetical protein
MLFLNVFLFSIVGTSVFVLGGNLGRHLEALDRARENTVVVPGEGSGNDLNVRIPTTNEQLVGFWTREVRTNILKIIRVGEGKVYHCKNRGFMRAMCNKAFMTRSAYQALTGGVWYKLLWDQDRDGGRLFVSGLL